MARILLERVEPVVAVVRDEAKAAGLKQAGAEIEVVDLCDVAALRAVLRRGRRAFLLNPPARPTGDTDRVERRTAASIAAALEDSELEAVVAQSTYGAQPGDHLGDLGVLYEFERTLAAQPVPATVMRAAYLMSNWDMLIPVARDSGVLPGVLPVDLALPMVAPADLGAVAADCMMEGAAGLMEGAAGLMEGAAGLSHVEGPERYSPADVARVLGDLLGRPVRAEAAPRPEWAASFRRLGFSPEAAASYANMTAATVDGIFPDLPEVTRGATTLRQYLAERIAALPPG